MSQAEEPHTISAPAETAQTETSEAESASVEAQIAGIVFDLEDPILSAAALTNAILGLSENRTLRAKPGTIYYLTAEIMQHLDQINREWKKLFALTNRLKAEAHRQSLAVAESDMAQEDQAFIDAVSLKTPWP